MQNSSRDDTVEITSTINVPTEITPCMPMKPVQGNNAQVLIKTHCEVKFVNVSDST